MGEVFFNGKTYKDIDKDALRAFDSVNIFTFRYYVEDKVWIASDSCAEHFGLKKAYYIEKYEDNPKIIYPADADKDRALYSKLLYEGEETASTILRLSSGEQYYKLTLSVLDRNEKNQPIVIGGIIEDCDMQLVQAGIVELLASDYYSVYDADFEKDQITPFRIRDAFSHEYGEHIKQNSSYKANIERYINNEVVEEEREDMLVLTSYESLSKKLKWDRVFVHEYRVLRDGKPAVVQIKVAKINDGPELTRAVVGFADVRREREESWNRIAYFDQVTLGPNFNYFAAKLGEDSREGYVVSLDIRDFKVVNDSCGIVKGDKILQAVDKMLCAVTEEKGYYGHVNSDHYVLFLAVDNEQDVITVTNTIVEKFEELVRDNGIPKITPYFGASKWKPGNRIQVSFSQANMAKHKIKAKKGVIVGFYSNQDIAAAIEAKKMEDSFEEAIAKERFEVWFQPRYTPGSKKMTGAEALVRLRDVDGNLISPGVFIPIYEKNGMIRKLDNYVYTKVCKKQKELYDTLGYTIPISINLSRASLFNENIVEEYKNIADKIGVPTSVLPIEITESAAIINSDIKELADEFFEAGFLLHVDDFGAGYSSLSTLNFMRFDTLKLDKSLIDYIGEFGGDRLIKHTVALAKDLGLEVIAEGVESENQVEFLDEVECDHIQGYIYSKPVPEEEFVYKLKNEAISSKHVFRNIKFRR